MTDKEKRKETRERLHKDIDKLYNLVRDKNRKKKEGKK